MVHAQGAPSGSLGYELAEPRGAALSTRERAILRLRYGLGGEDGRTLDEVARLLNLTRTRVRAIEAIALRKIAVGVGQAER